MKRNIIGISGKKGSGKDTIAKIIILLRAGFNPYTIERHLKNPENEKFVFTTNTFIKRFADPVKQIASILLDCDPKDFESEEFKNKKLSKRFWYYEKKISGSKIPYSERGRKLLGIDAGWGSEANLIKPTAREYLQKIGTEFGRILHPDLWVNHLYQNHDWENFPNVIVPDVRFTNEVEAIKDNGGIVIRVTRDYSEDTHPSETALDYYENWDYVIENTQDFEYLINQIIEVNEKQRGKKDAHKTIIF